MSNMNDFVIEEGVLKKYLGNDTAVVIPDGVTVIKGGAFYKNESVAVVEIPDSVIRIGQQAFDECTKLKEIRIPKAVEYIDPSAFRLCPAVESISVAEGNTHYYSENNCLITYTGTVIRGCKNSTIPTNRGIDCIGEEAFSGIVDLKKIYVPDGITFLGVGAFFDCKQLEEVRLPEGLDAILASSFFGCDKLIKVNIPTTVEEIAGQAFFGCKSLREIVLPGSLKFIGYMAFDGCSGLTAIAIPDGVETIEADAFACCEGVKSVLLGSSIRNIGESAFSFCTSLREISVNLENPYMSAVGNCVIRKSDGMIMLGCCGSELHPELRVSGISSKAFSGSKGLTCFAITDSIKTIAKDAFYRCDDLVEFKISSAAPQYSRSVCDTLFEAMKTNPYMKKVALYSIVKHAPVQVTQDPAILGKLKTARKDLVQHAITLKDLTTVEKLFTLFPKISQGEVVSYLQLCSNAPEIREYLTNSHVVQKPTQNISGASVAELKALFSFKDVDGGVLAMGYKGTESEITIPATVGKKRVLGVSRSFKSSANWDVPSIIISEGIEFIDELAFSFSQQLQSITIPASVREIRKNAFELCTHLTSVVIPRGAVVGWGAFRDCAQLSNVVIPDDVQLEGAVFNKCRTLANEDGFLIIRDVLCGYFGDSNIVVLPNGITAIGARAFSWNKEILKIEIPDGVEIIENGAFSGCIGLAQVRIPASVRKIEDSAFEQCYALSSVILPEKIEQIGNYAFANCGELRNIVVPDGVKEIGEGAFECCDKLQEIHLPSSVTSIGKGAFHWFGKLLPYIKIYAPAGSFAEKYAKKNKIPFKTE